MTDELRRIATRRAFISSSTNFSKASQARASAWLILEDMSDDELEKLHKEFKRLHERLDGKKDAKSERKARR